MNAAPSPPHLTPEMSMDALLTVMPGARRALFAAYHIGGCQSCGFSGDETLASVCLRNENLDVDAVIARLESSAAADAAMQISPAAVASLREAGAPLRLVDVRSREEFEAVALPGAELMTQELIQSLMGGPRDQAIVVYCHHGVRSLDAAAYLVGHGLTGVKSMAGGIDAWSSDVDPSLPRYRLEME